MTDIPCGDETIDIERLLKSPVARAYAFTTALQQNAFFSSAYRLASEYGLTGTDRLEAVAVLLSHELTKTQGRVRSYLEILGGLGR